VVHEITAVLVSWRDGGETIAAVESLADARSRVGADGPAVSLVVVDNGGEGAVGRRDLLDRWPGATLLVNPTNRGFGPANNQGARQSSGRYLLFLNNDTLVQAGWLSEMLKIVRDDESVAIVGIKQLFPYTSEVYHTGIVFTSDRQPVHLYPHLDASVAVVNKQREYQAVNGACLLVARDVFDDATQVANVSLGIEQARFLLACPAVTQ